MNEIIRGLYFVSQQNNLIEEHLGILLFTTMLSSSQIVWDLVYLAFAIFIKMQVHESEEAITSPNNPKASVLIHHEAVGVDITSLKSSLLPYLPYL